MFAKLKKLLFDDPTKGWPRSVQDAKLGELKLSDDAEWWEGSVELGGRQVGFKIGGEGKPDERMLQAAYGIIAQWNDFEHALAAFLVSETEANEFFPPYATEIEQLVIDDICLFWPERPKDGMIYFRGGEDERLWRCDYVNGKPQSLGFDS